MWGGAWDTFSRNYLWGGEGGAGTPLGEHGLISTNSGRKKGGGGASAEEESGDPSEKGKNLKRSDEEGEKKRESSALSTNSISH